MLPAGAVPVTPPDSTAAPLAGHTRHWSRIARGYAQPNTAAGVMQLLTTIPPLAALWTVMMIAVDDAIWLTWLLAVPAAAFVVRLFIIQHDCGHRSFLPSRLGNDILGTLIGFVTLTPHTYWRQSHNMHHATCGNLHERGIGDIEMLTVAEYQALPWSRRLVYRLYRNPAVLLGIGPIYLFVLKYRLPLDLIRRNPRLLFSVMKTNVAIAAIFVALGLGFGFLDVLLVQGPVVLLSSIAGVWLFYVQHQFAQTYWRTAPDWEFHEAAVYSSSFYDLPQPLRWLSGNIGIHHLHHLSSRIPNYRLGACLAEIPDLRTLNRITLRDSLSCYRLALWDEGDQRLISFKALRGKQAAGVAGGRKDVCGLADESDQV